MPHPASQDVKELFELRGDSAYGGESVTQLEHALQAAMFAEAAASSPALITAALSHDVGHLLHDLPENAPDQGLDDVHESLAAQWLKTRFDDAVVQPVALHVTAKRYLCAVNPSYHRSLSPPSQRSLELQGGPMSPTDCDLFRRLPFFEDAIQLRKWDDKAKVVDLRTPTLDHFLSYVEQTARG